MRRLLLLLLACLFLGLPAWASSVNINTAGQAELETLPGIGPAKASDIIAWRTTNGPFTSPAQLDDVPGIGAATLSRLLPLVNVGGASAAATPSAPDADPRATELATATARPADIGLTIQQAPASSEQPVSYEDPAHDQPAAAPQASARGQVDINSASAAELMALPGIGASKAALIVVSRDQLGPYSSCSDLQRVNGIGAKTVENLAAMCTTGSGSAPRSPSSRPSASSTPAPAGDRVDVNSASAAQLDTLPGIGASKAALIVADREQNGPYSSCSDLQRVNGIGATTVANLEHLCVAR